VRVAKDTVVTIEYRAWLDGGTLVDSTEDCGPITYLQGNEQIFPALEGAVEGLEAGAEREISLGPGESYGERREELVRRVPRGQLSPDLTLVPGQRYGVKGPDGGRLSFRLVAVEGETVVADFNSAAAGQGLHIRVKVLAVRAATREELRRGTLR
jgi:FKBP-type peptidyl-prolyl cis-trans isomerase SlyD